MARRKATAPARPAKAHAHKPIHDDNDPPKAPATRRFLNRGVKVEISEGSDRVELRLDDVPIEVSVDRGEYFAHVAHMFTGFGSIDALVDHLLANEGRTWTLHGHVCDERCHGGHHHGHGTGQSDDHPHHGHGDGHAAHDHPHERLGGDHHHGEGHRERPGPSPARKPPRRRGAR